VEEAVEEITPGGFRIRPDQVLEIGVNCNDDSTRGKRLHKAAETAAIDFDLGHRRTADGSSQSVATETRDWDNAQKKK
jgi:hypothetical protein